MMSKEQYYEYVAEAFRAEEFERMFGTDYVDPRDMDYSFDKVYWTFELECAYNDYLNELY